MSPENQHLVMRPGPRGATAHMINLIIDCLVEETAARLEGIHPDRDTLLSKTHPEHERELIQGYFCHTVHHLIESS